MFAAALVLPAATLILWGHYAAAQIPGGEFVIMPIAEWRWGILPQTLASIWRIMVSKVGLFSLIAYLAVSAVIALWRTGKATPQAQSVGIVAATVSTGMMAFLAFTYLAANFNNEEAAAAASFWRYMTEVGPMAVLATATIIPLNWLRRLPPGRVGCVLIGVTLVLPLAAIKLYRADLTSDVPRLRQTIMAVDAAVPRSAPLTLMDVSGNGFSVMVAYYDLVLSQRARSLPARSVTTLADPNGLSVAQVAQRHFDDGAYVWLASGVPGLDSTFGTPLSSTDSYLLRAESGRFALAGRWPISSQPLR